MDRIRQSLRRHGQPIRVVSGLLTTAIALWGGFSSDPFFPVLWAWLSDVVATGTLTVPTLTPGQWIALLVALLSLGILLYSFYLDYVAGPENAASARLKLQWPIVVQESESDQVQDKTTKGDGQSGRGAPTATDRYPCTVEGIEKLYHELGDVAASKAGTVVNRIKGRMKPNYTDRVQSAVSETERALSDLDKQTNAFRKVLAVYQ